MMLTRSAVLAVLAAVFAVATACVLVVTATEAVGVVAWLGASAAGLLVGFLLLGSTRLVVLSSVPILSAVMVEAGLTDDPSWVRPLLLGCLWFVTLELTWEAIERRDGGLRHRAVELRRAREVATVIGLAAGFGTAAAALAAYAPLRSVLVQGLVIGAALAGFVVLIRAVAPTGPAPD